LSLKTKHCRCHAHYRSREAPLPPEIDRQATPICAHLLARLPKQLDADLHAAVSVGVIGLKNRCTSVEAEELAPNSH